MTHLNIQQGSDVEIVSAQIIKKLYDTALTVSEPLEGETDAAYMSGHISVPHASEKQVYYLAGTIREGTNGVVTSQITNPSGRFQDLTIDVTSGCYIDFEDPAVEQLLITKGVSSDGVGVTESDAANTTLSGVFYTNMNVYNSDVTKFNEFTKFTQVKTNIPNNLFRNCSNLEEINLSDTITIGEVSFAFSGIKDINIPTLQSLGQSAFNQSKVETITNLGTITEIPNNAFYRCINLASAVLPTTLTSIGNSAFSMSNASGTRVFTTISGLENVTSFGEYCFTSNTHLQIQASDLSKAQTIGNAAFKDVTVIGQLYMKDLTSFGISVFENDRSITKILCLGNITNIPNASFAKGNATNANTLTEVYLPYECTSIGNYAFKYNKGLTTLEQYTDSVSNWVEGETPTSTSVISRVTSFGQECFNECSNLTTTIDLTNVTEIGQNAFRKTKIQVTGTPSANINISAGAFYLCSNLTSFDFSNITTLNDSVFYESGLSGTLSIPNLTGVLRGAEFYKCTGLTSITNLGSITSISDNPYTSGGIVMGSFLNCTGLTSITIPSTVTKIGQSAFAECTSLSQVNCSWQNIIEIGHGAFQSHADWDFIVNLLNLTTLGRDAFGGYRSAQKKIRQIYLPKITQTDKTTYYSSYMYYSGTFTALNVDIIYLRDIQSLHPGDFAYTTCTALVINNTTPPVWKNRDDLTDEETTDSTHTKDKVFGGSTITNIYVPDSAVTTYQNDANWSSVANKIQPLSNLTKVATEADLQANQVALIEAYM